MKLKNVLVLFVTITLILSCINNDKTRYIADFEEVDRLWLSCVNNPAFLLLQSKLVNTHENNFRVMFTAISSKESQECENFFKIASYNSDSLSTSVLDGNELWLRDLGPVFIYNSKGKLGIVDFVWTQYGYEGYLDNYYGDNKNYINQRLELMNIEQKSKIDSLIGAKLDLPIIKSWLALEGGGIEGNGNGTLILNKTMVLQRNPNKKIKDIEVELERVLGAKNIIWLNYGLAEDVHIVGTIVEDFVGIGTGGHTDEFVRFADLKTILVAWIPEEEKDLNPVNQINYQRMTDNYKILMQSKDIDGTAFKVIKIPQPNLVYEKVRINEGSKLDSTLNLAEIFFKPSENRKSGDSVYRVACASYLNYYLTNKKVMFQSYVNNGTSLEKENQVIRIFKSVFPDREIRLVDPIAVNWRGGGIHCITLNQPNIPIRP